MGDGNRSWEIGDISTSPLGRCGRGGRESSRSSSSAGGRQARWYMPEAGRAFVLWLTGSVGAAAAQELAQAVAGWRGGPLTRIRRGGSVRVVYGPDVKALAKVPIEADDAGESRTSVPASRSHGASLFSTARSVRSSSQSISSSSKARV
jgi:hypothetical protein